ncbi:putative quinol monooxygenase [Sphingomonas folli]|uniref:putative quinol monooxygenase n=1 Tax=Sphingomonas folli TaxID=2862497 RepID=UPI002156269B|nr:antibiotic biosynthesis monooxygenase [Sphingomonas folli]
MDDTASDTSRSTAAPTDRPRAGVAKALFVRLTAKPGKGDEVDAFLRGGLEAVLEEHDTRTWYAVRFAREDFAIFDTFPNDAGRLVHLAGKVGRALVARTPELFASPPQIEHADVLAFKLPGQSGQVNH